MTYQPQPTPATRTWAHTVTPRREASVVGVRQAYEETFGAYRPADWTLDAECTQPGTDPRSFYPKRGGPSDQQALAACAICQVREECLADALEFEVGDVGAEEVRPEVHGIRGGMVEKDRRRLVQKIRVERKAALEADARARVVEDYKAGELKVQEIALKHGVSLHTVTRWAKEGGAEPRPRRGGRRKQEAS